MKGFSSLFSKPKKKNGPITKEQKNEEEVELIDSFFNMVHYLAGGDITKTDTIMDMNYIYTLKWLSIDKNKKAEKTNTK